MRAITCKLSPDISTLYTTGRASIMSYWIFLDILLTETKTKTESKTKKKTKTKTEVKTNI